MYLSSILYGIILYGIILYGIVLKSPHLELAVPSPEADLLRFCLGGEHAVLLDRALVHKRVESLPQSVVVHEHQPSTSAISGLRRGLLYQDYNSLR